jgi:hypothetical protein
MSTNNRTPSTPAPASSSSAKNRRAVGLSSLTAVVAPDALPAAASSDAQVDEERRKQEAKQRKEQTRQLQAEEAAKRAEASPALVVSRSNLKSMSLHDIGNTSVDDLMAALSPQPSSQSRLRGSSNNNNTLKGANASDRSELAPPRVYSEEQNERFAYVGAAFAATHEINTFLNDSGLWTGHTQVNFWTPEQRELLLKNFDIAALCWLYHVCAGIATDIMWGEGPDGERTSTRVAFSDSQKSRSSTQSRRLYNVVSWALGSEDEADKALYPGESPVFYAVRQLRRRLKGGVVAIPRTMREVGYSELWVDQYLSWSGRTAIEGGAAALTKLPKDAQAKVREALSPLTAIRDSVRSALDLMGEKSRDRGVDASIRQELRDGQAEVARLLGNFEMRVRCAFGVSLPTEAEKQREVRVATGFKPLQFSARRLVVVEDTEDVPEGVDATDAQEAKIVEQLDLDENSEA